MKKGIIIILLLLISCDNHIGNQIYFQSQDNATDVGSMFGSLIYVGEKNNPNVFKKVLVYSDVVSYYKSKEKLYVKQLFNDSIFLNVCARYINTTNHFNSPYLPNEINQIISKKEDSLEIIRKIKDSEYFKKMNNRETHYYIIDIPNKKVEGIYNLRNFKNKLNDKSILNELEK